MARTADPLPFYLAVPGQHAAFSRSAPGAVGTIVAVLVAAIVAGPVDAAVITQDSRGAAVQISGESPAGGIELFLDADAAFNDGTEPFAAELAVNRGNPALSAGASSTQSSTLTATDGLLLFTTHGAVSAHGAAYSPGDAVLAAAVSNATIGFSLDASASLHLTGHIAGSGAHADTGVFGLTAVSLLRGTELIVALDSDNPADRVVDLVAALEPGDYILTIVASTSGTILPGSIPTPFAGTAGYQLEFSAAVVPLPGALVLLVGALTPLGYLGTRAGARTRVSAASC